MNEAKRNSVEWSLTWSSRRQKCWTIIIVLRSKHPSEIFAQYLVYRSVSFTFSTAQHISAPSTVVTLCMRMRALSFSPAPSVLLTYRNSTAYATLSTTTENITNIRAFAKYAQRIPFHMWIVWRKIMTAVQVNALGKEYASTLSAEWV